MVVALEGGGGKKRTRSQAELGRGWSVERALGYPLVIYKIIINITCHNIKPGQNKRTLFFLLLEKSEVLFWESKAMNVGNVLLIEESFTEVLRLFVLQNSCRQDIILHTTCMTASLHVR